MSVMRKAVVVWAIFGLMRTAAAEPQVGFVNAARDQARGETTIASLRSQVDSQVGAQSAYPLRAALEDRLPQDSGLAEALQLIGSAESAAFDLDHGTANEQLDRAEKILRQSAASDADVITGLADIQLLRGQILAARGKRQEALESFRLAGRLAPERTALDPGRYPPTVVKLYARAMQPRRGKRALVTIQSQPEGATVQIDGAESGQTPREIEIEPGIHYVTATLAGYRPRSELVTARAGQGAELSISLERMSPQDHARAIRAELIAARDPDWNRELATLASLAAIEQLVVIGQDRQGRIRAAVYDARAGQLSEWVAPESLTVGSGPSDGGAVVTGPDGDPIGSPSATSPSDKRSSGWPLWSKGLLVVAGVVAVSAGVYAIATRGGDTTYAVGNWSF